MTQFSGAHYDFVVREGGHLLYLSPADHSPLTPFLGLLRLVLHKGDCIMRNTMFLFSMMHSRLCIIYCVLHPKDFTSSDSDSDARPINVMSTGGKSNILPRGKLTRSTP